MSHVPALQILVPVAGFMATYVALLIAGMYLVQPVRMSLVRDAELLCEDAELTDEQRMQIANLVDRCTSFAVGLLIPIAVVSVALDVMLGRIGTMPDEDALVRDPRFDALMNKFVISVAAANPLAALFSIALACVLLPLSILTAMGSVSVRELVDRPAYRAAASFARNDRVVC